MEKNQTTNIVLIILLCWIALPAKGQNQMIDSLKQVLEKTEDDKIKADVLIELSNIYQKDNDSIALYYAEQGISKANNIQYYFGVAKAYRSIGHIYSFHGKYEEAIPKYKKAFKLFKQLDDKKNFYTIANDLGLMNHFLGNHETAKKLSLKSANGHKELEYAPGMSAAYTTLAMITQKEGNLKEAIKYLHEVMVLDSLSGNWDYYTEDLGNIATFYKQMKKYDEALEHSLRGLLFADSLNNIRAAHQLSSVVGDIYQSLENYESAEHYLKTSLENAREIGESKLIGAAFVRLQLNYQKKGNIALSLSCFDSALVYVSPITKPTLYNNVGQLYENLLANLDTAIIYYQKSIKSVNETGQAFASPFFNMAFILTKQNKNQEAVKYLERALEQTGDSPLEINVYKNIGEVYFSTGKYKEGYKYLLKANTFQDSLLTIENKAQVQLLSYEKEIRDLKILEKERQVIQRNYGIVALLGTSLFLTVLVYQRNKISKAQQNIAKAEKEKQEKTTLMSAELHHRIRNNLATFSSMISIKGNMIKDAEANEALNSIQDRIIALEKIHTLLYKGNNALEVEVISFLNYLINELITMNNLEENITDIHIEMNGERHEISSIDAIEMGKVINEVITNCFKYSIRDNSIPKIAVNGNIEDSILYLSIKNNGNPLPEDFNIDRLDSFGLKWVKGICNSKRWQYTHQNINEEVVFNLKIPLK